TTTPSGPRRYGQAVIACSVIVPARDAAATIGAALDGLARQQTAHEFEVIVVDDGSRDATAAIAAGSRIAPRVLEQPAAGPAVARNRGARGARAGVLAFLDADCVPSPGWLDAGLAAMQEADLVQGAVHADPQAPAGPFDRTLWVTSQSPLFESANLFVQRALFERLEGFESWLRPVGGKELGEDVVFGWSARRAGARTAFSAQALVHHAVFPRRVGGYIAERARLRHFPAIAARVPELRRCFFYRRIFLTRRSAAFDLALLGAAASPRRPLALAAGIPYVAQVARDLRVRGAKVAAVEVVADAVGLYALARGSVSARTAVL
ncbi:MAG TPA: glycosyltransferase family A protein, partial [Xanthobacteraceae bacterium]|nr:glycosyltransferase family A protein [Xanthobacteraceae bacterium]